MRVPVGRDDRGGAHSSFVERSAMNENNPLEPRFTSDNLTHAAERTSSPRSSGIRERPATSRGSSRPSRWRGRPSPTRSAGLGIEDVLGEHGDQNVHGEPQQKMDVIANEIIMRCLGEPGEHRRARLGGGRAAHRAPLPRGRRTVLRALRSARRLDRTSTCSVGVGTIFSVLRNERRKPRDVPHYLQPGLPAGRRRLHPLRLVGGLRRSPPATASTCSCSIHSIGAFVLVKRDVRIPTANEIYSINEAYSDNFPAGLPGVPARGRTRTATRAATSARWWPTCIGRCSRAASSSIRRRGRTPKGKLRLMYEANPMAMIIEQAGGKACAGQRADPRASARRRCTSARASSSARRTRSITCSSTSRRTTGATAATAV